MKLAAGICFYEKSLTAIQRCIESIKNDVDIIFAIDGRFDHFPDKDDFSSPEVRDYLRSISHVVLVDLQAGEIEKRQKYCDMARDYGVDYLLIIDSDEYVIKADWKAFRKNLAKCSDSKNVYGIRFAYSAPVHFDTTPYPRLWHKPYEMHYIKHNLWHSQKQGDIRSTSECPVIEGIIMTGDNNLVTPEYIQKGRVYQEWLIRHENPGEKTWLETFEEADLDKKLDLFMQAGGSGKAALNDLLEEIVKARRLIN